MITILSHPSDSVGGSNGGSYVKPILSFLISNDVLSHTHIFLPLEQPTKLFLIFAVL